MFSNIFAHHLRFLIEREFEENFGKKAARMDFAIKLNKLSYRAITRSIR